MLGFSDLHWRCDTPAWRKEPDYSAVLRRKLKAAFDTGESLVFAGDIFHRADDFDAVFDLLTFLLQEGKTIYAVRGQHDMDLHNNSLTRTGYNLLWQTGSLIPVTCKGEYVQGQWVYGMGWEETMPIPSMKGSVLLAHVPVSHGSAVYAGASAATAFRAKASAFDIVLTGDNHKRFEVDGLYNAGCFHRMSADLADQAPAGWLIKDGEVKLWEIPCPAPDVDIAYRERQDKGTVKAAGMEFVTALAEARATGGGDVFLTALKTAHQNTDNGGAKVLLGEIIQLCEEKHT